MTAIRRPLTDEPDPRPAMTAAPHAVNGNDSRAVPTGLQLFLTSPTERIQIMRQGVPAAHLQAMAQRMGVTRTALLSTLRLSAATIRRKMQIDEPLSVDESERVLGIEYLIGQVQNMVNESGVPTGFDAAKWLAEWIYSPVPALGNKQPAAWLDTMEGQKLISDLLAMSQSGAYA